MQKHTLPFQKVPQFAKTDLAYATGEPALRPFYTYEPRLESFKQIIAERQKTKIPRADLVDSLHRQYKNLPENPFVTRQIDHLLETSCFTVTTAHQPSLFLGPLYFIYKAITTINLAEEIQGMMGPDFHFVPVFVLGAEDHDLEELNHIQLFNKQLRWEPGLKGPVGPMPTSTLSTVLEELHQILGDSEQAAYLWRRIERAYREQPTVAAATQAFLHDLFGRYGLVVLQMGDPVLKRHLIPVMREELLEQSAYRIVNETIAQLNELGFKTQAAPREINLFYLMENARERIVRAENGDFQVLNTDLTFSTEAMLATLEAHPERFSPNVVLRPLYQEIVLPNLAYVGGGGELAYWLERKALFAHYNVPFPALVRRNSVLWLDRDAAKKRQKFGFSIESLFEDSDSLIRNYVSGQTENEVSLEQEIAAVNAVFEGLASKAAAADPSLEKAVRADAVRQVALLEQWQSRIMRSEKQKHEVAINQIRALKEKICPANGLQERYDNFMPYLLKYGEFFLDTLKESLRPLDQGFIVLEEA